MAATTAAERAARKAKRITAALEKANAANAMDARGDVPETDAELEAVIDAKPAKATKAAKPQVECGCGCGAMVSRRFLPGHDGRLKGNLIRSIKAARTLGIDAGEHEGRMADLGWAKFIPAE